MNHFINFIIPYTPKIPWNVNMPSTQLVQAYPPFCTELPYGFCRWPTYPRFKGSEAIWRLGTKWRVSSHTLYALNVDVLGNFCVYVMMKLTKWFITKREFQLHPWVTCGIKLEKWTTRSKKLNWAFFHCLIIISFIFIYFFIILIFQWKIWWGPEGGPNWVPSVGPCPSSSILVLDWPGGV